ncbi:ABC transporter permease [bacterium]|nr:ABC transporter permease [bacterium]
MKRSIINIYKHRALVRALVSRELKARYRSSLLGLFWSFLNPLLLMSVYVIVFTHILRFDMPKYASFLLTGLLPWIWFSSSVNEATVSIVAGGNLIKKVMFPAEILPLVSVLTNLVHYTLSLVILIPFVSIYGVPSMEKVLVPEMMGAEPASIFLLAFYFIALILIQFIFTFGLALGLSAITVYLRDIQHIITNLLTLWFFACPIIYPITQILGQKKLPSLLRQIAVDFNPITYLIIAYHKVFICRVSPGAITMLFMFCFSLLVLFAGYFIFERFRDSFAEEV